MAMFADLLKTKKKPFSLDVGMDFNPLDVALEENNLPSISQATTMPASPVESSTDSLQPKKRSTANKVLSYLLPALAGAVGSYSEGGGVIPGLVAGAAGSFVGQRKAEEEQKNNLLKSQLEQRKLDIEQKKALRGERTPNMQNMEYYLDLNPDDKIVYERLYGQKDKGPTEWDMYKFNQGQRNTDRDYQLKQQALTMKSVENSQNKQKPLSGDASKLLEIAQGGLSNLKELQNNLNKGSSLFLPKVFDRDTDALLTDLSDSIGRLRSGGAIGAREESSFRTLIPSFLDSEKVKANKLRRLNEKFSRIQQNMGGNQLSTNNDLTSQNEDDEAAILEALKKRGVTP